MVKLLFVLKTAENPAGLTLLKVALLVAFYRKDPTSCDVVATLSLACINKIVNIVFKPRLAFQLFRLQKLFGVLAHVGDSGFLTLFRNLLGGEIPRLPRPVDRFT